MFFALFVYYMKWEKLSKYPIYVLFFHFLNGLEIWVHLFWYLIEVSLEVIIYKFRYPLIKNKIIGIGIDRTLLISKLKTSITPPPRTPYYRLFPLYFSATFYIILIFFLFSFLWFHFLFPLKRVWMKKRNWFDLFFPRLSFIHFSYLALERFRTE